MDEGCFYVDMEYILYPIPFIETICFMQDFVYQYRIGRSGQSVAPRRMARLQDDYDRVLRSLLIFTQAVWQRLSVLRRNAPT